MHNWIHRLNYTFLQVHSQGQQLYLAVCKLKTWSTASSTMNIWGKKPCITLDMAVITSYNMLKVACCYSECCVPSGLEYCRINSESGLGTRLVMHKVGQERDYMVITITQLLAHLSSTDALPRQQHCRHNILVYNIAWWEEGCCLAYWCQDQCIQWPPPRKNTTI